MSSEKPTSFQWLQSTGKLNDISLLSPFELEMLINQYCIAWESHYKIATALGLEKERLNAFLKEMGNPSSPIRIAVDLAKLKYHGEMRAGAAKRAKESVMGLKAYNELITKEKTDQLRDVIFPEIIPESKNLFRGDAKNELSLFGELQDFFLNAKPSDDVPVVLQEYWTKLNIVDDLLRSFEYRARGRKYIMNIIRQKLSCSEQYAYRIINEATQFFNINENKNTLLNRLFEDLEKIKAIAIASQKDDTFIAAVQQQKEIVKLMTDSTDIPPELYEGRVIITSHDPKEFGIAPVDRGELSAMIKKWKLDKNLEQKLLKEIDYEPTQNPEDISE